MQAMQGAFTIILLVTTIHAAPGDLLWRFNTGHPLYTASPFALDGYVFTGSYDRNTFYAVNSRNGTKIWLKEIGIVHSSRPFAYKDIVFIGGYTETSHFLLALKASNGDTCWCFDLEMGMNPYCLQDIVFFSASDNYFYALNANNGSLIWRYQAGDIDPFSPPVVNELEATVFFGSGEDSSLYALDMYTGQKKWIYKSTGEVLGVSITKSKGLVFATDYSNRPPSSSVFAVKSSTGERVWSHDFISHYSPTCYGDNKVYFITGTDFYALDDSTGNIVWTYSLGSSYFNIPSYKDSVVYLGSRPYDSIIALNSADGSVKWKYTTGDWVDSSPYVENGVVYCGSDDNYLYAIETYGYMGFKEDNTFKGLKPLAKSLYASPNPFRSTLNLDLPSPASIYSQTGQLIKHFDKGNHKISTSNWRVGVYLIKCGKETKRIVKLN